MYRHFPGKHRHCVYRLRHQAGHPQDPAVRGGLQGLRGPVPGAGGALRPAGLLNGKLRAQRRPDITAEDDPGHGERGGGPQTHVRPGGPGVGAGAGPRRVLRPLRPRHRGDRPLGAVLCRLGERPGQRCHPLAQRPGHRPAAGTRGLAGGHPPGGAVGGSGGQLLRPPRRPGPGAGRSAYGAYHPREGGLPDPGPGGGPLCQSCHLP